MNEDLKINLMELIIGLREPKDGMEKHFLKVIKDEAIPCSQEEKEWFEWWKKTHNNKKNNEDVKKESTIKKAIKHTPKRLPDRVKKTIAKIAAKQTSHKMLPGSFGSGKKSR